MPPILPMPPMPHLKQGELIHGRETAQENGKEDEEGGENDDLMMLV